MSLVLCSSVFIRNYQTETSFLLNISWPVQCVIGSPLPFWWPNSKHYRFYININTDIYIYTVCVYTYIYKKSKYNWRSKKTEAHSEFLPETPLIRYNISILYFISPLLPVWHWMLLPSPTETWTFSSGGRNPETCSWEKMLHLAWVKPCGLTAAATCPNFLAAWIHSLLSGWTSHSFIFFMAFGAFFLWFICLRRPLCSGSASIGAVN